MNDEQTKALLIAANHIVEAAFQPHTGMNNAPTPDERKALAEAGVSCLLDQAQRVLSFSPPPASGQ